jgi:hypothetical protein
MTGTGRTRGAAARAGLPASVPPPHNVHEHLEEEGGRYGDGLPREHERRLNEDACLPPTMPQQQ